MIFSYCTKCIFQGAGSLVELLEKTKEYIPKEKWNATPLSLKATAGLRLLPEDKAKALLDEVSVLSNSLFILFFILFQG